MTIDHDAIAARVWQDRETGTPGPWHHDADDQRGIDYTDPRSGTCWSVAYVHSHCGHPIDGSSANAHRIAALPDLEAAYLSLYYEVTRLRAERDRLRVALVGLVTSYDRDHWMRSADFHRADCECLRCAVDIAREALKGDSDA